MDLVLTLIFTPAQQRQIDSCRIYLQVHMLSDITTADGTTILPEVIRGYLPEGRQSSLLWPVSVRPTEWSAWQILKQIYAQVISSSIL
jgi:hypothetical protein